MHQFLLVDICMPLSIFHVIWMTHVQRTRWERLFCSYAQWRMCRVHGGAWTWRKTVNVPKVSWTWHRPTWTTEEPCLLLRRFLALKTNTVSKNYEIFLTHSKAATKWDIHFLFFFICGTWSRDIRCLPVCAQVSACVRVQVQSSHSF